METNFSIVDGSFGIEGEIGERGQKLVDFCCEFFGSVASFRAEKKLCSNQFSETNFG